MMKQLQKTGSNHPCWKGGRIKSSFGYWLIWKPTHKFANHSGYVFEHRLVWEHANNASLLPWSSIHHKNGKKDDNRIENLQPMTAYQHNSMHHKKDMTDRKCNRCGSSKTGPDHDGYDQWYRDGNGYLCSKCKHHDYDKKRRSRP